MIVINAEKVVFTGRKTDDKLYQWHTGYPGGLKQRTPRQILEQQVPRAHPARRPWSACSSAGPCSAS